MYLRNCWGRPLHWLSVLPCAIYCVKRYSRTVAQVSVFCPGISNGVEIGYGKLARRVISGCAQSVEQHVYGEVVRCPSHWRGDLERHVDPAASEIRKLGHQSRIPNRRR